MGQTNNLSVNDYLKIEYTMICYNIETDNVDELGNHFHK